MSNRDFPVPYRPGRGPESRPADVPGQHSSGSSRGARRGGGRSLGRGGAAAADGRAVREGRLGTGVRDIRDDLRERLRRNGVNGDWDEPGGHRPGRRRGAGGGGDWDGPGGREPRRKGSWWRHWSWKKALTVVAVFFGTLLILAAAGVAYAYSKTPIPNVQSAVLQQASKVYFSDGKTEVGQFGSTNRVLLTYSQFPPVLRDAVVAAEDKNFWHEGGISPTGILRAAYYDLTSSGGSLQGGSTITQQLVRNYYENIGTAQTLSRKVKEIFVAEKLAQAKSKEWILQQYLNTVYFGDGAYGAAAAAQVYFGLAPGQLSKMTPAQAAMIASMIQSPSYFSPNPKDGQPYQSLVYRWKYVLGAMRAEGTLSPQAYAQAVKKFPPVVPPVNNSWSGYRGYIMQAVQNELQYTYNYSLQKINSSGMRIVTTFNENLMNSLYATVRANERIMRHCAPPAILSAAAPAPCKHLPRYVRAGAVLENVKTGAIMAMYSGPSYTRQHCGCQFDNALQSRNQVGSSFKPYVLATAVDQGMNVQTSILNGDSPLWIPPDSQPNAFAVPGTRKPSGGGYYEVVNDESGNNNLGPVSVRTATAVSLNTAYTDLWHRVAYNPQTGKHPVTAMAKAFGVDVHASGMTGGPNPMQDEAGIALGQASLTVEEQATTIATIADGGVYHTPHVIKRIIIGNSVVPPKITTRTVLGPAKAADVAWALAADTTSGGTAAGLGMTNGQPVIAKTGTTNLSQSAFFMGATPKYAMADALFVNHPGCTLPPSQQYQCTSTSALAFAPPPGLQTLFGVGGLSGYGGQYPALIWHTFMVKNFSSVPVQNFPPVNSLGTKWNLFGRLPVHKPRQHDQNQGGGGGGCQGQGQGHRHCHHGGPTPTASPTPTSSPTGSPTPTPTSTGPHLATRSGSTGSGGAAGAGALALAVVVMAVPSLPVVGRLRGRRARRSASRSSGG